MMFEIRPYSRDQKTAILDLLESADLPTSDLSKGIFQQFLVAADAQGNVAGVIALEQFGEVGLLRSLVVRASLRGSGLGTRLVEALQEVARDDGVREIFLLTTTAAAFFSDLGFSTFAREDVPPAIAATSEFRDLCPQSAVCQHKIIQPTKGLQLTILEGEYAIWKLPPETDFPMKLGPDFLALTRTPDEFSGVSPAHLTPKDAQVEAGWRCIRVTGPLAFHLTGILASIATPLARADISIFAVSTYDTDYVLIPALRLDDAAKALCQAGHVVMLEEKK